MEVHIPYLVLKEFNELSGRDVYELALLRQQVFMIEQACLYSDLDGVDLVSTHILLCSENTEDNSQQGMQEQRPYKTTIVGCIRIVAPELDANKNSAALPAEVYLGRLVVKQAFRNQGFGAQLVNAGIKKALELFPAANVMLSGQAYLERFYISLGFRGIGDIYDEDGIAHRKFIYANYQPAG